MLDYLFLDASFFRMHPGSPAEPVLAAWGITTGGKPAFIGLAPGTGESADGLRLLQDLRRSLLEPPRQLRPRTATAAQPGAYPETAAATA
jgi:putative transposase